MSYFIVSLGPFCITKTCINNMQFESPTMPFDWMFSSLTFIKNVLKDNFQELLNKKNIYSTNPCWSKNKSYNSLYNSDVLQSKNITTHLLYKNELDDYNNFHMWNHYNLLEEEQYAKYFKYVERFRTMLNSTDLKIFFYIQYYDDNTEEIIDFNHYLSNNIKNYKFVCIHCKKSQEEEEEKKLFCYYNKNNLYIYNLLIKNYQDNIDLLDAEKIKTEIHSIIDEFK
jgi:hypothetical protein